MTAQLVHSLYIHHKIDVICQIYADPWRLSQLFSYIRALEAVVVRRLITWHLVVPTSVAFRMNCQISKREYMTMSTF